MESASQETRDDICRRVLSFAMYTDESELFNRNFVFWTPPPSFLPLLLVSKTFYTLALPYLFRCLIIPDSPPAVQSLRQQLLSHPVLGSAIRRIYLPDEIFSETTMISIFSAADRLEVVKGLQYAPMRLPSWHDLDQSDTQTSGATLHTFSVQLSSTALPLTLFSPLKVLRSLELSAPNVKFDVTLALGLKSALATLEDLRLEACDPSLVQLLTCMDLNALRLRTLHS
ncbi:hypothetical protein C8J57DRAFT_1233433 [Mycena rebaudengoi]|nr:hypothetical protein C8J57DRAFT_1233433 [Mycena rebaudengoi]